MSRHHPGELPNKPPARNILIDLGFGVLRVQHDYSPGGTFPNVGWNRTTTLTVMAPAETSMSLGDAYVGRRSAESATVKLDAKKAAELVAALLPDQPARADEQS